MSIRKTFGPVWGASGVQGFFGEGYWYQQLCNRVVPGYSFEGVTFVAKTATANPNTGNMPLDDEGISPRDKLPACIKAGVWQYICGVMLNSVGLSNIGIEALAEKGRWQEITKPFMISIMTIGKTPAERRAEMEKIVACLMQLIPQLRAPVAIQLNESCPNTDHKATRDEFLTESLWRLSILASLGVPIFVKINVLASVDDVKIISDHKACSGIIVSNTLPWAAVPKWMKYLFFGSVTSPLARFGFGDGGLSGWPLQSRVCAWIREARKAGISTHINAGGGIFGPLGVQNVWSAGADSISLGSIAAVRPWMLWLTIKSAHWLFR